MKYKERLYTEAQFQAAKVDEWLLPAEGGELIAEGMERTYRFKQSDIKDAVEEGVARKIIDLSLPDLGPYSVDLTRSGRFAVLAGRKGHLALLDWQRPRLFCEVQVRETCRDVTFLHNEQFFAVAQKKYGYIYDKRGAEVHCLKETAEPYRLDFLPHHFLLTSVGAAGVLTYQDTSHGGIVAQHRTRLGSCDVMRHNPRNAVVCLGHGNGTVTMWTPNMGQPVVKMLCHRGPLRALAVDPSGSYLVTAGLDSQVKVWDVRTYKELHSYFSAAPADSLDISQRGLLAVGWGKRVQVWKDALAGKQNSPYMNHAMDSNLSQARFVPYEDVLALGHSGGFSTMLVPGAGEANFDSWVADPFQGTKARREAEVRGLLDKLPPEMITLEEDDVARVIKAPVDVQKERAAAAKEARQEMVDKQRKKNEKKAPMKGKNRPTKRHRKKQENVVRDRLGEVREKMKAEGKVTSSHLDKAQREAEEKRKEKRSKIDSMLSTVPKALHGMYRSALQKMV